MQWVGQVGLVASGVCTCVDLSLLGLVLHPFTLLFPILAFLAFLVCVFLVSHASGAPWGLSETWGTQPCQWCMCLCDMLSV